MVPPTKSTHDHCAASSGAGAGAGIDAKQDEASQVRCMPSSAQQPSSLDCRVKPSLSRGAPASAAAPPTGNGRQRAIFPMPVSNRGCRTLLDHAERRPVICSRRRTGNCFAVTSDSFLSPHHTEEIADVISRILGWLKYGASVRSRRLRGHRRSAVMVHAAACVFARDTWQALLQRRDGLVQRSPCGRDAVRPG